MANSLRSGQLLLHIKTIAMVSQPQVALMVMIKATPNRHQVMGRFHQVMINKTCTLTQEVHHLLCHQQMEPLKVHILLQHTKLPLGTGLTRQTRPNRFLRQEMTSLGLTKPLVGVMRNLLCMGRVCTLLHQVCIRLQLLLQRQWLQSNHNHHHQLKHPKMEI